MYQVSSLIVLCFFTAKVHRCQRLALSAKYKATNVLKHDLVQRPIPSTRVSNIPLLVPVTAVPTRILSCKNVSIGFGEFEGADQRQV